ncbi:MAG: LysR family transcriptional regulator, partial [Devosiaceae bacterium]|nr:LysR family transcriptional regulator [Devosiaceae bacterium MH13]
MDKHSLELFVETVRTLSFAETARRLGLDPSHVSRSVLSLEREVGATLLARTTRRMTLTEAGRGFHTHARATLSSWEAAVDAARDAETEVRGPVRISVSVAFGETLLVPLLPQLRRALPSVVPELVFDDTRFDLIDAGLDLAIRLGGPPEPDLRAERL